MQVPKRAPPAVRPRVSVAVSGGDGGDAAHWDGTLPTPSSATTDEEQSAMDRQFTLLPLVQSNQSDTAQDTRRATNEVEPQLHSQPLHPPHLCTLLLLLLRHSDSAAPYRVCACGRTLFSSAP